MFQIFKTMRRVLHFKLRISSSVESFQSKFIIPRYLKQSCLKGKGHSCFSDAILEEFDLRGKFNSFEIPCVYKERLDFFDWVAYSQPEIKHAADCLKIWNYFKSVSCYWQCFEEFKPTLLFTILNSENLPCWKSLQTILIELACPLAIEQRGNHFHQPFTYFWITDCVGPLFWVQREFVRPPG